MVDPFCVTQMSNGPFIGLIFLCKGEGEPVQETNETRLARWMDFDELKHLVNEEPEKIYQFCGVSQKVERPCRKLKK